MFHHDLKPLCYIDLPLSLVVLFFPPPFFLYSENVNRKAFKESVKPGWHYFGRKMVSSSCTL